MPGIIVQREGGPGSTEVAPGGELTFGRDPSAGLTLADPAVSRVAGRVRAMDGYWLLSNLSRAATYVVENPEGAGEYLRARPRRLDMPVPFEFARVLIPAGTGTVSFLVFAPAQMYADPDAPEDTGGDATAVPYPLDVGAKYFLVLVALCEPRLRDPSSVVIPTVPEIIERLGDAPGRGGLTRAAVNFHIDYLAAAKLRVKDPAPEGRAAKADWQRAALVSLALRFNLVRDEHLALLPAPEAPRGGEGGVPESDVRG
ncbi:FHA domain-containing protein [Actinomadura sp. NEAU-AAG7]|uniref:FHA domain-containing protein n=1 Tax=Actinomadura sp. NEAU-AAG7 TaxID=2839640 RepID=UPI001BE45BFA|nr:FHA domain-containing protein [Actinomadura sp. NEAU-AAG7]MBT2213840.1 winged helix-turn-helix domain-containing protein [Actinomadura sp. NEAU-AAG7]